MIIDAHLHVWDRDWHPEWLWEFFRRVPDFGNGMEKSEFERNFVPAYCDLTGETLIAEMDKSGTDISILMCVDWGLADPEDRPKKSIWQQNEDHAAICKRYPDRVAFFFGVDPRRHDAPELLEAGVKELGAVGWKCYPPAGWWPSDKAYYPMYEKAQELDIPVLFHCGPVACPPGPLKMKYSHPLAYSDLLIDFPELNVILAHNGLNWWHESTGVLKLVGSAIADLGWWPSVVHPEVFREPAREEGFWRDIRHIFDNLEDRLVYASDYNGVPPVPAGRGLESIVVMKKYTDLWRRFAQAEEKYGVPFTNAEMENFFHRRIRQLIPKIDEMARAHEAVPAGSSAS